MVAYINATRKQGEGELRHDNFMAKVPDVLKEHLQFKGYYLGDNGKYLPCYNFPRREATFMAMSYSYELQQTVYDAWQAAEAPPNARNTSAPLTFLTATLSGCKLTTERSEGVYIEYVLLTMLLNK